MIITNGLGQTFDTNTMTGWEVKRLAAELRAEFAIARQTAKMNFLRDQISEVDSEIRAKMY